MGLNWKEIETGIWEFQFDNDLYKSSESIQTIILSLCIGIPICLFQFLFSLIPFRKFNTDPTEKGKVDFYFKLMGLVGIFCGAIFYIPSILKYFYKVDLQKAIEIVISGNAGVTSALILVIFVIHVFKIVPGQKK